MQHVKTSCLFHHSPERVWAAMSRLTTEQPALDGIDHRFARGDTSGPEHSSRRRNDTNAGVADYGSITFDVPDTRLPVRFALIELILTAQKNRRSELTMIMRYQPKYGILGRIICATMMKPIVRDMLCRVLLRFDEHILSRPLAKIPLARRPDVRAEHDENRNP